MRNMAVRNSPAFSYPLPVLVRVLSNLLIFKGKILYYNKYSDLLLHTVFLAFSGSGTLVLALGRIELVAHGQ